MSCKLNSVMANRESRFELLRLFSMFTIVLYHLYLLQIYPIKPDTINKAIQLPLHVGVPLFIMISGYFGIHPSLRGCCRLLVIIGFYSVALLFLEMVTLGGGNLSKLLFISHSPYWFIKSYLYLFIFAPVINLFLNKSSRMEFICFIVALVFIQYIDVVKGDELLGNGKSLINFIFLYVIGHILKKTETHWMTVKTGYLLIFLSLISLCEIVFLSNYDGTLVGSFFMRTGFSYCGPLTIISAITIFIIFGKLKIKSTAINIIALSVFPIYLLHESIFFKYWIHILVSYLFVDNEINNLLLFVNMIILTIIIMVVCVLIDKLLSPLIKMLAVQCEKFLGIILNRMLIQIQKINVN